MNRRQALVTVGVLTAGLVGKWPSQSNSGSILPRPKGGSLTLHFGDPGGEVEFVIVSLGRRQVKVTPAEIMDALEGK